MVETLPVRTGLRVVSGGALTAALDAQAKERAATEMAAAADPAMPALANHILTRFRQFQRHRNTQAGWSDRLLAALRMFNGQYDADKLAQIQQFGGSTVYARIVAMKCRGASSLLRDIYLAHDRPWGIDPPDDPTIPPEVVQAVTQLVQVESATREHAGQPTTASELRDRTTQLMEAAREAAKKRAKKQAEIAEDKLDEILDEGGFYTALSEFITDIPLFPFACIKGPTVRIVPTVKWENGTAAVQQVPKLFWARVSPFDIWWSPGVSDIEDAEVIERTRVTRADLNDALDLPGYNATEVRAVLDEYGRGGLVDNWDRTDSERAILESRENPIWNQTGLINCLEYVGNVQGNMLREWGMTEQQAPDESRDYKVQAWLIGRHVIKVQLAPSPRKRHTYFISSFEKVPGTPVGNALPDILSDIQEAANATLRALINNESIASGPQVVINDERLMPGADGETLYPWKRWHVNNDAMGNTSQVPVSFFQPLSNANELLAVYGRLNDIADEVSAIPKYLSGNGPGGGAGRTSSGLAMLMGNASKILQTVAANIDRDVISGIVTALFDMVMLTDTSGLLTGEENVVVKGVQVAIQRETQRTRQLEFLQTTANPLDMGIMGAEGRAVVLRSVASTIGIEGEAIVPDAETLAKKTQEMAAAAAQAQGDQKPGATKDAGPRENLQQQSPISGGVH